MASKCPSFLPIGGGLCRMDAATGRFIRFQHDPDDPTSLSHDDRPVTSTSRDIGNIQPGPPFERGLKQPPSALSSCRNGFVSPSGSASSGTPTGFSEIFSPVACRRLRRVVRSESTRQTGSPSKSRVSYSERTPNVRTNEHSNAPSWLGKSRLVRR